MIESTYRRHLSLCDGNQIAAALLVLAEAMQGKSAPEGPMTVRQAAEWLGISERVVRDLVATGALGHCRVGNGRGQIRILPADLEAYQGAGQTTGLKHLFA